MEGLIIVIGIILIIGIAVFPFFLKEKTEKNYREQLSAANTYMRETKAVEKGERIVAIASGAVHLSGLPGTGSEKCQITVSTENVTINTSVREFKISMEKITGAVAETTTRTIENTRYTTTKSPSIGKAVVGGALFGTAGAVVGAMSGTEKTTAHTQSRTVADKAYLTINYVSDNTEKKLEFEGEPYCRLYEVQDYINAYACDKSTYVL